MKKYFNEDLKFPIFCSDNFSNFIVDISVISCNGLDINKSCLNHIIRNTDSEKYRLIWIDNGSKDGTVDFLQSEIPKIKNYIFGFSQENLGVIGGRNLCYNLSKKSKKPDYFLLLDNDQFVYDKNWLNQHIDFMNNGNYGLIGCESWQMNKNFLPIKNNHHINDRFNYVSCCGMMIKKEVTDTIGFLDDRFNPAYFEDPDIVFRTYDAGYDIGWNLENKIMHVPHQTLGNMENKQKTFIKSYEKFKEKYKGKEIPTFKNL